MLFITNIWFAYRKSNHFLNLVNEKIKQINILLRWNRFRKYFKKCIRTRKHPVQSMQQPKSRNSQKRTNPNGALRCLACAYKVKVNWYLLLCVAVMCVSFEKRLVVFFFLSAQSLASLEGYSCFWFRKNSVFKCIPYKKPNGTCCLKHNDHFK